MKKKLNFYITEKELNRFLILAGYKGPESVGQTPRTFSRDKDILQSLKDNAGKYSKYVILDDDGDIANSELLIPKWIAPIPKLGLTKFDVLIAVRILNG